MAYREVGTMDIDQVIRRWLAGEKIRAIARLTGFDRPLNPPAVGPSGSDPLNVSASARASRLRKIKDKLGKKGKTKKDEANFDQCWNRSRSRSQLASNLQCGVANLPAAQL